MFACIASADDFSETKEIYKHGKLKKMSKFLNLNSDQKVTIKSIMQSSFSEMEKNKEKLTKIKEALSKLDLNDESYKTEVSTLSNEMNVLIEEQVMLRDLSRKNINDELDDDQLRRLAKAVARVDSKKLKRNKFKHHNDEHKSDRNMRKMNDKRD